MPDESVISLEEIRVAVNRVLGAVEQDHGPFLRLVGDRYWTVPVPAAFEVDREPDVTVGRLGEDVEAVRALSVADDDDLVAIWYELAHLAGVLKAVERLTLP
jgi:hypothetical protein